MADTAAVDRAAVAVDERFGCADLVEAVSSRSKDLHRAAETGRSHT